MTDYDRLKALRSDFSPKQAFQMRKQLSRTDPARWVANALAFDWHSEPSWMALASFRYAERLRTKRGRVQA